MTPKIQVVTREREYVPILLIEEENTFLRYTDKFGRSWNLIPNTNENIQIPFIVIPVPKVP